MAEEKMSYGCSTAQQMNHHASDNCWFFFPFPAMLYPCDMLIFRWPTTRLQALKLDPLTGVTHAGAMAGVVD